MREERRHLANAGGAATLPRLRSIGFVYVEGAKKVVDHRGRTAVGAAVAQEGRCLILQAVCAAPHMGGAAQFISDNGGLALFIQLFLNGADDARDLLHGRQGSRNTL